MLGARFTACKGPNGMENSCCYIPNRNAVFLLEESSRITWRALKIHDSLRRTNLTNSLGRLQLERDERRDELSALQNGCSCSLTVVNTKGKIGIDIIGLEGLQKATILPIY